MHVRKTRTAVAKVCSATVLALLLCGAWCQAATTNPFICAPPNTNPVNSTPACPGGTAILAPNASPPDFPRFAFSKGSLDMIITFDFITLQINSATGNVQDICSLLS